MFNLVNQFCKSIRFSLLTDHWKKSFVKSRQKLKSFHLTTEEQEIQMVGARSLKINDAHSSLKNGASCLKKGSESLSM